MSQESIADVQDMVQPLTDNDFDVSIMEADDTPSNTLPLNREEAIGPRKVAPAGKVNHGEVINEERMNNPRPASVVVSKPIASTK
ncbi:hypothetical protein V6N13_048274 [Hibiscus sabdariffa]|uniref:Uncharacterized protein n=1 Tax=Hibiscus sabdariffa TaxID=183260 RepID=A0ABR2F6P8_9ROSI